MENDLVNCIILPSMHVSLAFCQMVKSDLARSLSSRCLAACELLEDGCDPSKTKQLVSTPQHGLHLPARASASHPLSSIPLSEYLFHDEDTKVPSMIDVLMVQ